MASEPEVQADGGWRHRVSDCHPLADDLQGIQMLEQLRLDVHHTFFCFKCSMCSVVSHVHIMSTKTCFSGVAGIAIM